MAAIRGRAALWWTDTDDTMTARTLLLREPLRELRAAHTQSLYRAESLDKTSLVTFTVGEGADELVGRVRYADDPQGLIDFLKAGSKGRTVVYIPDTADGDVRYSCLLVSPLSPLALGMDPDRGTLFGDQDVEVRLRKTDETPFAGAYDNATLFEYRAGGRIEEGTFSRAGVASYPELAGGGGYGTLTTAASGAARLAWYSTASSAGPRSFPALLLEEQRTNRVLQSENFASTSWTKSALTVTTGQSDPRGGTNGALLIDASTVGLGSASQIIAITASTNAALSIFLRAGTTAFRTDYSLRSTNNATTYTRLRVTWSSGVPTQALSVGGVLVHNPERWRGGWYRFAFRTTGALTTGNYRLTISPASTAAANKANVYAFGAQVETA